MTQAAVRTWLAGILGQVNGLEVYDALFKSAPARDLAMIAGMPSEEELLSFGLDGATKQTTYTPDILVMLLDPSAEDAQHVLDRYTQTVRTLLQKQPSFIPLTDTTTGETSQLAMVGPRISAARARAEDLGPSRGEEGDAFASVIIRPTLVEWSTITLP